MNLTSKILATVFVIQVFAGFHTHAQSPLEDYPLILSCHNALVVAGTDVVITHPEELYSNIDWHAGSGAIFMLNVFTNTPQWESKIDHRAGVPWPDRPLIVDEASKEDLRFHRRMIQVLNQRILNDYGTDPVKLLAERAKERDVTFFVKFRMNDHHMVRRNRRNVYYNGYFWMDHVANRDHDHFDYREPEVRQYFLDLMEEVLTLHPVIEGFEMDFMRSPHFFNGPVDSDLELMNDFMREARSVVNRLNRENGRQIVLGASVPLTVAACREAGLDVGTWAREGLVDYLVPKRWQTEGCESFPNLDQFRKEAGGAVKILGHYNDYNDYPKLESAAAVSALYQKEGADGLHLFNVWNDAIEINSDPTKRDRLWERLSVLKPDTHLGVDKCYSFGKKDIKYGHSGNSPFPGEFPGKLPLEFDLTTGENFDLIPAVKATLVVRVPKGEGQGMEVSFNGTSLKLSAVKQVGAEDYPDMPVRLYSNPLATDSTWDELEFEVNTESIHNKIRGNHIQVIPPAQMRIFGMYLFIDYP